MVKMSANGSMVYCIYLTKTCNEQAPACLLSNQAYKEPVIAIYGRTLANNNVKTKFPDESPLSIETTGTMFPVAKGNPVWIAF